MTVPVDTRHRQIPAMERSIGSAHRLLGLGTIGLFLVTGVLMRRQHLHLLPPDSGLRVLFRSRHVYLLFSGLVNLALGGPGWLHPGARLARASGRRLFHRAHEYGTVWSGECVGSVRGISRSVGIQPGDLANRSLMRRPNLTVRAAAQPSRRRLARVLP